MKRDYPANAVRCELGHPLVDLAPEGEFVTARACGICEPLVELSTVLGLWKRKEKA